MTWAGLCVPKRLTTGPTQGHVDNERCCSELGRYVTYHKRHNCYNTTHILGGNLDHK